jgi:hypothetical protein
MHRQKETLNTPQSIIDETVTKHRNDFILLVCRHPVSPYLRHNQAVFFYLRL